MSHRVRRGVASAIAIDPCSTRYNKATGRITLTDEAACRERFGGSLPGYLEPYAGNGRAATDDDNKITSSLPRTTPPVAETSSGPSMSTDAGGGGRIGNDPCSTFYRNGRYRLRDETRCRRKHGGNLPSNLEQFAGAGRAPLPGDYHYEAES